MEKKKKNPLGSSPPPSQASWVSTACLEVSVMPQVEAHALSSTSRQYI